MATGLLALLDDVATLAKAAAASVDDVAAMAGKAGAKAAGVVIDDAAVTPRYVTGFSPARELPVIWRIALGSLRNKLLILLPAALALSFLAPWAITPLLMLGGAYLCFEGVEKLHEALFPHADTHGEAVPQGLAEVAAFEDRKVTDAVRTDFILSAEIMAITLAAIPPSSFWTQATVLATVGVGITVAVYGVVALIVKADDFGLHLATRPGAGPATRRFGRAIAGAMPKLLRLLGWVGTAAMIWVGGGIILHGLEEYGFGAPSHLLHDWGVALAGALPAGGAVVEWLVHAAGSAVVGLLVGAVVIGLLRLLPRRHVAADAPVGRPLP
ncbi:DUF808 domain-containing protein [Sabulicella rubraurantiaca]|uniref:DUF808 domain-containing protein n=1 Tax=Sabulicella rubraurantiaca TaxID=2811429 RepID=UPI001A97A442|nr:DUF808 domain-containing protein [Sabulicella rubraurantiaca]